MSIHRPLKRLLRYWANPTSPTNAPEVYLKERPERTKLLLKLANIHFKKSYRILEIGCNAGRQLEALRQAGFEHLAGIEISKNAIKVLRAQFPKLTDIRIGAVENLIRGIPDNSFDAVFTLQTLKCIHFDSDWIFAHIARIAGKAVLTMEDEKSIGAKHFPRNYKKVFERLGMTEIKRLTPSKTGVRALTVRLMRW